MESEGLSRRQFIRSGALAAGGLTAPAFLKAQASRPPEVAGKRAPRIIFMVSDGMSTGILSMADILCREIHGRPSHWQQLLDTTGPEGSLCWMDMSSATGAVTDSSAAASSWGGGHRILNTQVNVTPDGKRPQPILVAARQMGIARGLVTTSRITHATPAGFLANHTDRNDEDFIAAQYLERGADVFLGGGSRHFDANHRVDAEDLLEKFANSGYRVIRNRDSLLKSKTGKPLFGVFGDSHLPYSVDHLNDPVLKKSVPTLAEMTDTALRHLEAKGSGFLLQIEGARIDHGAHANDTPASLFDQLAFDAALGVALEFRNKFPDTILVLTTDHGNANPGLNGHGNGYSDSMETFRKVAGFTRSYTRLCEPLVKPGDLDIFAAEVRAHCGIDLKSEELGILKKHLKGKPRHPYTYQAGLLPTFSAIMANHTAVGWCGSTHTSDWVPLLILGDAVHSQDKLIRNTDLHLDLRRWIGA